MLISRDIVGGDDMTQQTMVMPPHTDPLRISKCSAKCAFLIRFKDRILSWYRFVYLPWRLQCNAPLKTKTSTRCGIVSL